LKGDHRTSNQRCHCEKLVHDTLSSLYGEMPDFRLNKRRVVLASDQACLDTLKMVVPESSPPIYSFFSS
jgi:hypothetical protein